MLKRIFDILASLFGLIALSPFFLFAAVWIKKDSPGPVFFRQRRVGLRGRVFRIHKFRTMRKNAETGGKLTVGQDDKRITRSGRFLRKYKLDEFPQLIDVLTGHMSLVGPRPEVEEYIECYPEDVKEKILSVKPGITDKASIEMVDENKILSRYNDPQKAYIEAILPVKQKHYLDYVDNQSFLGDLVIILKTLWRIIAR